MDDKDLNLQAEDTLAIVNPEAYVLSNPTPRDWTMDANDIAKSVKINPIELVTTKEEREGDQLNMVETFGTGVWNSLKGLPKAISSTIDIANIEAYSSANMSELEAKRLVQDALYARYYGRKAEDQLTAEKIKYNTLYNISGAVGDLIKYAGVGIVGGLPAVTGVAAAETYAESEADMVDSYIDKKGTIEGYAKKRQEDVALAGTYGIFSGLTETVLGVERIAAGALGRYSRMEAMSRLARQQGKLYKSAALKAGRRFGMSAVEEGAEEFIQQVGEDTAKYWADYEDAVLTDENFKKAITAAAYGALIGGPAGWGLYRLNRQTLMNKINNLNQQRNWGMSEQQVVESADQILDDTRSEMLDEIATRAEIKNLYGEAFDTVKARVGELIDATGTTPWTDQNKTKEQYVQDVAQTITLPAILQANKAQLPLSEFLEIADLNVTDTASGKAPILNFTPIASIEDLQILLDRQNAIIKEETDAAKIGNADPNRKQDAQRRKAILQYHIRARQLHDGVQKFRRTRKKERADYAIAKDLQPEQTTTLDTAVQAEAGEDYVLFAGKRIPVQYAVVELSDIQPSHINGAVNPNYTNVALQNRASRGTVQDLADLQEKASNITPERLLRASTSAEGAPVVNGLGEVIAGNGRAEIVRLAYENPETGEKYKNALRNAGYNIEGMERPILVRRNTTMTDAEQVAAADISNISETSAFDEASQARRDTQYLKDSLTPEEFASKLPMSERRGLMQNNGKWNQRRVQQRYEDALLSWLTGNDTQLFENLVLDRGISQKVIDILTTNGSHIYELATKHPELGLREDLYHALQKMQIATKDNFLELTQQVELDGRDVMPENVIIWNWLYADNTTNRQFMSNYIATLQANVEAVNAGQDMFGDSVAPLSKKDALMQALKKTDESRAQTAAQRGREYDPLFTQETGEIKNPELASAVLSYNNQFAVQNPVSIEVLQQFDLADENARLDDIYPEYTGETIEVDGKERTVYNSNGDRIAKSKEALTNFWRWFGDSKVVDEQGRPLVVYHGTSSKFDTFSIDESGKNTGTAIYGQGFYFTTDKEVATKWGAKRGEPIVMGVYVKLENPNMVKELEYPKDSKEKGFDGVIAKVWGGNELEIVAFEPTQIKSVDNRGTYDSRTPNIYYQTSVFDLRVGDEIPGYGKVEQITDNKIKVGGTEYSKLRFDTMLQSVDFTPATVDFNKAVDYFGTTTNLNIAGYILPDGRLLDFSGKKFGADGRNRTIDHREVGDAYDNEIDMDDFLKNGAIRIDVTSGSINIGAKPTTAQMRIIEQIVARNTDSVSLELENNGPSLNEVYDDTTPTNIKRIINQYFTGGQVSKLSQFLQRRGQVNGFYDPEIQSIVLGKYWNETTLVHEFHHRYLEKIWGIYKQAIAGTKTVAPEWIEDTRKLFEMLEINPSQDQLTTVQQERFASMVEAYITGLGIDNQENMAFKTFLNWVPEKYKSIMNIGYLDENNEIQNPFLDEKSIEFFNKWFASPIAPGLSTAPDAQRLVNVTDADNNIVPSNQKVMNNREKEWGQDSEEQNKADAQLWRAIGENTPSDMRAALDGEEQLMKAESKTLEDDRVLPEKPKLRDKWFKTRVPNAREVAAEKAREYLAKNPEHARELAFADPEVMADFDAPVDHGMLIRAVMETVEKGSDEWYILDNNLAVVKSMSGSTLSLSGDLSHQAYLDAKREVENARELKAAVNYAGTRQGALDKWNSDIRAFAARRVAAIMATDPNSEERKTAIKAFLEEAKTKFSGNTTNAILNQLDLTAIKTKNSQVFIRWAEKQIKEASHARIDTKEQAELMKASVKAQLALRDINSTEKKDGKFVRAVQSAKDIRHWQFVKDKMKKAYIGRWGKFGIMMDNLFGGYMPSAMLMSVNTLFFANVPSTAINQTIVKKSVKLIGDNKVDTSLQKDEIQRIKQIFNASGMNLAQMEKPTSPSTLHGEKYMNTEQAHWYNFTFEILGRTDNEFRVPTFVDTLARIATKNANGDTAKANMLFREYIKLGNKDEDATIARKQALAVANMAVFTQDGTMASALNHIRSQLNNMSRGLLGLEPGGFGLGNILAPFLKTGANVVEMGLRASIAPVRQLMQIAQRLQGKEIPDLKKIEMRVDWTYFALTMVTTALMSALTSDDDEWYIEPYKPGQQYDPDIPYDSIKMFGVWVKLDIFGPLEIPLRTAAMLVKNWEAKALGEGFMEAMSETPLVQQFTDSNLDYMTKKPGKYWTTFGYNQANKLVPSQLKSVTRAGSRAAGVELDISGLGPTIERKFHRNYGLDGERLTTNDLINILTNRLKTNPQ